MVPNKLKKDPGVQELKFFYGLKQTLISRDLDLQNFMKKNGMILTTFDIEN